MNINETFPLCQNYESTSKSLKKSSKLRTELDSVTTKSKESPGGLELALGTEPPQTRPQSLPTTPAAAPKVHLPYGNPPSPVERLTQTYSPGYLDDVTIPSPFLYHTLENEYVAPSNDMPSSWGIPYFEYAYGQAPPQPDFTSYRQVTAPSQSRIVMKRRESLGFALGDAATSRHKAEESRISNESHDSSTHGCPLPCLSVSPDQCGFAPTSQWDFNTDPSSEYFLDVPLDPDWSWAKDVLRLRHSQPEEAEQHYIFPNADDNLIYPTMPTPAYIRDALASNSSLNNVVQPWANQAAARWDVLLPNAEPFRVPCDQTCLSYDTLPITNCTAPSLAGCTTALFDHTNELGISPNIYTGMVNPMTTPLCMDLLPARLYQHQIITWPTLPPVPRLPETNPSDFDGVANDSDNVLKLCDWLVALNATFFSPEDDQVALDPPLEQFSEDAAYQFYQDLTISESPPSFSKCALSSADLISDEALLYVRSEEEFASTSHYDSELELLSESETDDQWAYWDWGSGSDNESQSGSQSGLIESEIGLPNLCQGAVPVEAQPAVLWGILR